MTTYRVIHDPVLGDERLEQIVPQPYIHEQAVAATTWTILHGLGAYPSVSPVDTGGTLLMGKVVYDSDVQLRVIYTSATSGRAYLNA